MLVNFSTSADFSKVSNGFQSAKRLGSISGQTFSPDLGPNVSQAVKELKMECLTVND